MEGAELLEPDDDEVMALAIFSAMKNGSGGLDWGGLPIFIELFGVEDVAALLQRLLVIKSYRKPSEREATE